MVGAPAFVGALFSGCFTLHAIPMPRQFRYSAISNPMKSVGKHLDRRLFWAKQCSILIDIVVDRMTCIDTAEGRCKKIFWSEIVRNALK